MASLMRAKDWSTTPLGKAAAWPQSLRTLVRMLLTSRFAMWMGWGPDLTFFYNDAYARDDPRRQASVGARRGRRAKSGPRSGPTSARASITCCRRARRPGTSELLLFLERSGFPEETYHTFSYSPVTDDDGRDRAACSASSPKRRSA